MASVKAAISREPITCDPLHLLDPIGPDAPVLSSVRRAELIGKPTHKTAEVKAKAIESATALYLMHNPSVAERKTRPISLLRQRAIGIESRRTVRWRRAIEPSSPRGYVTDARWRVALISMSEQEPVLEIKTKSGTVKRHGLSLNDIAEAQRLLAEGEIAAASIEKMYPNWQEALREAQTTAAQTAEAARFAFAPIAETLKQLDLSRLGLADSMRQAAESAHVLDQIARPPLGDLPLTFRDPDEATRDVAQAVRDLAQVTEAVLENSRTNAQIMDASLKQTAALVTGIQALHETTRQGIAAGERREQVLVGLTRALVVLTVVLVIPVVQGLWHDSEAIRNAALVWISQLLDSGSA